MHPVLPPGRGRTDAMNKTIVFVVGCVDPGPAMNRPATVLSGSARGKAPFRWQNTSNQAH
jgi:hypothetical protein